MRFTIDPETGGLKPIDVRLGENFGTGTFDSAEQGAPVAEAPEEKDDKKSGEGSGSSVGKGKLRPPSNLRITEQQVVMVSGVATVDATLTFDEVPGIDQYDVRISE